MKKGKASDFSLHELPQNRKDQYFFLLRNQYWTLLKIGLLALAFALPYVFLSVAKDILNLEFLNLLNEGSIAENEYHTYFLINTVGANLLGYLLLPILAFALSGLNRVFRGMVEGGYVLFKGDFSLGVKTNYGRTVQGALLFGLIFLLHQFVITYFQSPILVVPSFLFIFLLIVPISFTYFVYSSYYDDKFFRNLGNSIGVYASTWWRLLLLGGTAMAVYYGLDFIPIYHLKGITEILSAALLFPLYGLLLHEVAIKAFDFTINSDQFPDRVGLGLYKPSPKSKEGHR